MTKEEMKTWINNASYEQLLHRWRFAPIGSFWFQGEIGDYYKKIMDRKALELSHEKRVQASKSIGWG